MLSAIGSWLLSLIEQIGYLGIMCAMFLENIFPPIPSELIMPFGWFLAWQGTLQLWRVIGAGVVGTYLWVLPFYFLWYRLHKNKLLQRTDRRGRYVWISPEEVERAFHVFHKRGSSFVLFGRFIPIFRTVISFPAGAVRMPFLMYSVYTLLWSAVWCTVLAYVWFVLGDQRERVGGVMKQYEHVILAILVLGCIAFLFRKKFKKKTLHNI